MLNDRFPRISSEVSDLQERFQMYRNEMEIEKSKLADHELALKQKRYNFSLYSCIIIKTIFPSRK